MKVLASYRSALGDRRAAVAILDTLARANPEANSEDAAYQELSNPYQTAPIASYEYINGGSSLFENKSKIGLTTAATLKQDGSALPVDMITATAENNHAHFKGIQDTHGKDVDTDVTTQRYAFMFVHPFTKDEIEYGVTGSEYTLGGHVNFESRDLTGSYQVKGQFNEPNWDYGSTVAFDGRKTALAISRQERISSRLRLSAETGDSVFSLKSVDDAAQDFTVKGLASYLLIPGDLPVELSYGFNGDYFYKKTFSTARNGKKYGIFSAESTEFHALNVGITKTISQESSNTIRPISISAFGGYAYDRLGSGAPQGGVRVRGGWWRGPEFFFEVARSFSTIGASESQTRALASCIWHL